MKKNKLLKFSMIFFIVSLALFCISFYKMEPDYLWHIKAGEYIFHHGLLKKDIFSWIIPGKYWMSHEWLFELIIYSLKYIFGKFHILIYCSICVFSLFFILFYTNKSNIKKNILFSLIWISLVVLMLFSIQARPHLISNCLLALTIYFLYDLYNKKKKKKIYLLPIVQIIWANVHGGSSNLVYIFCLLFFIIGLFNFKFKKIESKRLKKKQLIKYFIVFMVCCLSVIINIHGIKMFIYPYQNMMDSTMINNIAEWTSTSLNDPYHYIYYGFILLIFIIMLFSDKRIRFIDFVLFLISIYLGLKSIRFWFYTYIIASYYIYNYVNKRNEDDGTELGICILSILFSMFFIFRVNNIINVKYSYLLSSEDIKTIKSLKVNRLFNMYDYGGDLIYNDIDVFVDGRADLYSKYNYNDYLNITNLDKDYVSLIKKYDFDYMLIDDRFSIGTYLKYTNDYQLLYSNKHIKIYKKMN